MMNIGSAICYARTIEAEAVSQIASIEASAIGGSSAHIRIMPDAHAGKGCVIGTTMYVGEYAIPSVVGVDIGCGVLAYHISQRLTSADIHALDVFCRTGLVSGCHVRSVPLSANGSELVREMHCVSALRSLEYIACSMGTLGGGNHFVELDVASDGSYWLIVHTGSRHLGLEVANYYQTIADTSENGCLSGMALEMYLHDIALCQRWAVMSRRAIMADIMTAMGWTSCGEIESIHNYIDTDNMILRKGAISAQRGEMCLIPLNMRDGTLLCRGRGSAEWNFSAPHGAGRLMSRGQAKRTVSLEAFQTAMAGIVSSSVCTATIDESPFAYKDYQEIMEVVGDTVEIMERITPVFNYKATD